MKMNIEFFGLIAISKRKYYQLIHMIGWWARFRKAEGKQGFRLWSRIWSDDELCIHRPDRGRQTSIQFTNRILFFISSSYPKIFPHTTLPKGRSATIRPLESTAGCMLIILSRNPSPVSMAPIPTTQCHRREPSIRQMTVFSSRRPSFQRVIYPWLCPLAITQQSQIWSDWPNKHYSKRPWRCQPR